MVGENKTAKYVLVNVSDEKKNIYRTLCMVDRIGSYR